MALLRRPEHPSASWEGGLPSLIALGRSSWPDPRALSLSPPYQWSGGSPASVACAAPLGDLSLFSDPSLEELGVARPERETMGLPEQDDTPSRHNSGAAAWEGRWRGPSWGPWIRSSACPPHPHPEPEGTFGSPGRPGCGRRVESAPDLRETYSSRDEVCNSCPRNPATHRHKPRRLQI